MGDVCCAVIHGTVISVFYDTAVKSFGNTVQFVDISIDDQSSVLWKKLRKLVERTADIVQILEEIQMILVNIENNAYLWKEMKETVGVFAGFRNEQLRFPTFIFPPIALRMPPTEIVGSISPASRICESMDVVVVLP